MQARRIGMSTAKILIILRGSNISEKKIAHPSKMFTGLNALEPGPVSCETIYWGVNFLNAGHEMTSFCRAMEITGTRGAPERGAGASFWLPGLGQLPWPRFPMRRHFFALRKGGPDPPG